MDETHEFWSIKERRVYSIENSIPRNIEGVFVLCTPQGEPLVVKKR